VIWRCGPIRHLSAAQFRFYAELNDLLPAARRQKAYSYAFSGRPSVKDAIEALGVPHTEVDLILVNGASVGFDHRLQHGDRVAVYPVFESLDISPLVRLRDAPLRRTAFVLDVHLGKLARLLRMLGFDALYRRDYEDSEIVTLSVRECRVILTRDIGLLKHKVVTHGYWVRSTQPIQQAREVVRRFDLASQVRPLTRCIPCNGVIAAVDKEEVLTQLPPRVASWHDAFYRCMSCGQVYWPGSHYDRMQETIARILE
jgi:uncharacterized protein with PIN domain